MQPAWPWQPGKQHVTPLRTAFVHAHAGRYFINCNFSLSSHSSAGVSTYFSQRWGAEINMVALVTCAVVSSEPIASVQPGGGAVCFASLRGRASAVQTYWLQTGNLKKRNKRCSARFCIRTQAISVRVVLKRGDLWISSWILNMHDCSSGALQFTQRARRGR